ncbi:helix-turn-helix domain-containing protein [Flavobacterium sp. RHBU_3]|uniref:helix-turn-helix domain-containing protein n=1 Tax=Flavobacterium sp. RHBU_3 TaxID=3391184 RepID=UPI003984F349
MPDNPYKIDFQKLVGARIFKIRSIKGLSLREVAQNCDLDFSDIGKYEKGEINFKVQTLYELARGLGVHPKELFDFDFNFADS